jgi:spermidine synthase
MPLRPIRRFVISWAAFTSGAAGLIFEVVWLERAGLVFGNGVWAASLVLSSFMAGLAIGNALVARRSRLFRRPLLAYAVVEAVVAISGIALTYALPQLGVLMTPVVRAGAGEFALNLTRLVTAFGALLVPTTALGATFPLLVGSRARLQPNAVRQLAVTFGQLYGWNTLGAVAGVIAAELWLIDRLGITGSAWCAGALDLAAAGAAIAVGRAAWATSVEPRADAASRSPRAYTGPRALFVCAFLSGATLLALEVVWFRALAIYELTTTMAVSVMLAVVLAGIGVGGLAAARWLRRGGQGSTAGALALAGGASVLISYVAFQSFTTGTQVGQWPRMLWFACLLTAVPSFFSGAFLTKLADYISSSRDEETRAAALLTLANTAGAACGSPIAAFALLPWLGMERALLLLAIVYVAIACVAVVAERAQGATIARGFSRATIAATGAFVVALALFPFVSGRGAFARAAQAYASDGSTIVATREGAAETIFVMQQQWLGQPVYSRLVTNGFSMSGTTIPAMRYMRYFAYWPMLLHAAPLRHALVICYGVGVTAAATADIPALESLDVVEISRDVIAASDVIYAASAHPLHDSRVRLHVEDGRFFLQTTAERFDLITGEPPPPRTPGAVNIYTREYFQLLFDRLAEGGITTYWVPVARPEPGTDVNTIIRAFCGVFDDCSLWNGTPSDLMLVGTRHATGPVSEASFVSAWQRQALAARLAEIGFERPEQVGATFLGDAAYLRQLTAETPPLTDDFPQRLRPVPSRPSLSDPRYRSDPGVLALFGRVIDPVRARRAFAESSFVQRLWPPALVERTLPWFDTQRIVNRALWEGGAPLRQIEDLHVVLATTTLRTLPLWLLGSDEVKERIAEHSAERSGEIEYALGLRALANRDYLRAAAHLGEAERRGLRAPTVRPLEVYALCLAGDLETARLLSRGITPRGPDEAHAWTWLRATFHL